MIDWQKYYEDNPKPRVKSVKGLTHGFGINDLDYVTDVRHDGKTVYRCKAHHKWSHMLRRCYGKLKEKHHPSYTDVTVCAEFKSASNFKDWMFGQVYKEGEELLVLDKDLLSPESKLYSPETCAFIPEVLNWVLYTGPKDNTSTTPLGVRVVVLKDGSLRYVAVSVDKSHIGTYSTPNEAHLAWQRSKLERLGHVLDEYRLLNCYRFDIDQSVVRRMDQLSFDISSGLETQNLIG